MIREIDDVISAWFDYGQARLLACMAHHTLAQVIVLAVCFVVAGMIELSIISAR